MSGELVSYVLCGWLSVGLFMAAWNEIEIDSSSETPVSPAVAGGMSLMVIVGAPLVAAWAVVYYSAMLLGLAVQKGAQSRKR